MTAQHVLLAQTKIGFLTGGRGYSFQELSPEDKQSQREEAFARATVALTRAQRFCFIMCPLDMKGIIGAATVVGCLQHGVGICDERSTGSSVELKAGSLAQSRDDANFLAAFRLSATVKTGELLTHHILCCRRPWSSLTTQGDAARCYSHASMLTGSLLTRKCLPHSSLDLKKEFSEMCSFRKRCWRGTAPLVIELW